MLIFRLIFFISFEYVTFSLFFSKVKVLNLKRILFLMISRYGSRFCTDPILADQNPVDQKVAILLGYSIDIAMVS